MFAGTKRSCTFANANRKQLLNGAVVQLVRIHACHAWGRGFESRPHRKTSWNHRFQDVLFVCIAGWPTAHALPVSLAEWRTSGTHILWKCHYVPARSASSAYAGYRKVSYLRHESLATHGATLAILAESNRYAADMPVSTLLQAKASSSHLWPAPCASFAMTEPCAGLRSRPRCGASCVPQPTAM